MEQGHCCRQRGCGLEQTREITHEVQDKKQIGLPFMCAVSRVFLERSLLPVEQGHVRGKCKGVCPCASLCERCQEKYHVHALTFMCVCV